MKVQGMLQLLLHRVMGDKEQRADDGENPERHNGTYRQCGDIKYRTDQRQHDRESDMRQRKLYHSRDRTRFALFMLTQPQYVRRRLIPFEAQAPQPTPDIHGGVLIRRWRAIIG
jgi:hypothetical protein